MASELEQVVQAVGYELSRIDDSGAGVSQEQLETIVALCAEENTNSPEEARLAVFCVMEMLGYMEVEDAE